MGMGINTVTIMGTAMEIIPTINITNTMHEKMENDLKYL